MARWASDGGGGQRTPAPVARHVARGQRRQMNRAEFQSFAAVDGHHPHRVHVGGFGRDRPVSSVFVQRFDPAHAVEKVACGLMSPIAACSPQTLSSW